MAGSFPTGITTYTNPGPADATATEIGARTHDEFHADSNDDLEAVMAKLGTGSSTPAGLPGVLRSSGGGSAWGELINADVAAAAGIVISKLAAGGTANRLVGTTDGTAMTMQQIVAAMIANDTITATQLAADCIGTSELADAAVATANIIANAVAEIVYTYTGGAMFSGSAITATVLFDYLANQTFSVASTSSIIGIFTTGGGQVTQTGAPGLVTSRAYIDSAGANTRYNLGGQRVMVAGEFANPFTGHGGTFITGLSAGSHTINFKLMCEQNGLVYQRASDYESFGFKILEWKR